MPTHRTLPHGRTGRLAATLAAAALLLPPIATTSASARPARAKTDTITISVADVKPAVLPTDTKQHPLTVTLVVTNRSEQTLTGVNIEAERGEPINGQAQLEQALKHVTTPTGSVVTVEPKDPVTVDLAPGASQEVVFRSTTSTIEPTGLCNCTNGDQPALIYPLFFTAHVKGAGGVDQNLGLARTFVSAFRRAPTPVRVSWVWPLVDQPHLLDDTPIGTSGPVFTDDFLAASVGTGGRLDKALEVAEQVAQEPAKPPLTLLIDPELLDELQLMASGPYQVQTGKTSFTTGSGRAVAEAWLERLRALLDSAPQFRVQFTPYADPDVESLQAAGLSWSAELPTATQERVAQALGPDRALPSTTLAWPAGGALGRATLSSLVRQGIGTVLLNGSAITPKPAANAIRPGLARLSVDGRDVAVGVLDQTLQKYVQQAVTTGKAGPAVLPLLTAELTIRAVAEPTADHVAVLAPPRWVDADVANAVRTIVYTSGTTGTPEEVDSARTSFATAPIALDDAVGGQLLPNGRSHLASVPAGVRTLPAGNVAVIERATQDVPALTSVFTPPKPATIDPQAQAVLAEFPLEEQRVGAAAWGRPGFSASAAAFGQGLLDRLDQLTHAIAIVAKPGSSYTLASDNSPFPLTVRNTLPWPVTVQADVQAAGGLPGFDATPKTATVGANQKASFKLATNVGRAGRIRVVASLSTPDGSHQIGDSVELTVRSTALGAIGVIITVGAGAVLVLALLIRFGRRLRHRWSGNGNGRPRWDPDAPDAAQTFAQAMREREEAESAAPLPEPAAERSP